MQFPWANVSLMIFLLVLLVTGYLGFTSGHEPEAWLLWLHGIAAYGLIVLLYWKSAIILDTLRRKNRWTKARIGFALMAFLLLITLALGLLWTFAGPIYVGGFSLVSLHIYVAVPLLIMVVWHSWRMRFVLRLPATWSRRLFLGTAVSAVSGLFLGQAAAWSKSRWQLPGARRRFTGSYEWGSVSGMFPAVSWIADHPQPVDVAQWRLVVDGAVERPLSLTYDQVHNLAAAAMEAVLDCTGGWYTEQLWEGMTAEQVLQMAGIAAEAQSVTFTAVTGYRRRFSIGEARGFLLATGVGKRPLSHDHGFPVRLVAKDRRGVEWVKWVTHIQVNQSSQYRQSPLPLQ